MSLTNSLSNSLSTNIQLQMTSNIVVNIPGLSRLDVMHQTVLGNTVQAYLVFLVILALGLLGVFLLSRLLRLLIRKWNKATTGHS